MKGQQVKEAQKPTFEEFSDDNNLKVETNHQNFDDLDEDNRHEISGDIKFLLDVPLVVSVELGRTKMLIYDLLQLGQGSVIELDKIAGEPMEILVNNKLIARGEVVVVNEKFGIRLTDIISPTDRLKQLK